MCVLRCDCVCVSNHKPSTNGLEGEHSQRPRGRITHCTESHISARTPGREVRWTGRVNRVEKKDACGVVFGCRFTLEDDSAIYVTTKAI